MQKTVVKKYVYIIAVLVLLAVVTTVALCYIRRTKSYEFDEITDFRYAKTEKVMKVFGAALNPDGSLSDKCTPASEEKIAEIISSTYKIYDGDRGCTAHTSWLFLDKEGELLFRFTDLGNRYLVCIEIDGNRNYYVQEKGE